MGKGKHGFGGFAGWGHGGFGGWGFGHGGFGFPFWSPFAVSSAVAMSTIAAATCQQPYRYNRYNGAIVIVQRTTPSKYILQLTCPAGIYPGDSLEMLVDGHSYFVVVPDGVHSGDVFQVSIN